jgi:hypothetical protein
MRRVALLCLAILVTGGAACVAGTPKPKITSPAAGSTVGASGDVDVVIDLVQAAPPGGVRVKLLSGIDEQPATTTDVTSRFTVNGTSVTGTLGPDDLGAGRNTLFVNVDVNGDGFSEASSSATFGWSPVMRAAVCSKKITPVTPVSSWKDDPGMPPVNHSEPIYMAGFGTRTATGVHDHLWARGFVLESRGRKVAVVVLDLIGYFNNEIETIRALVNDPSFDAILVSSTHVHEGPDAMGLWGPNQVTTGVSLQYLDFVNATVAACIQEADAALQPAEIRFATTDTTNTSLAPWTDLVADGGVLQRDCVGGPKDAQGTCTTPGVGTQVEGDAGPVINALVPVLQLRAAGGGAVLATLVNYASHPESLGSQNPLLTSDFPHFMREALEARFGGVAIYQSADLGVLQGPLDVHLADPASPGLEVPRRTFAFAQVMGEILADRAGDAVDAVAQWDAAPKLDVAKSGPVLIDVPNPYFRFAGLASIFGRRTLITGPATPSGFAAQSEVMALRIGRAQFAATPNELDPQIGDLYRAQMTGAQHRFVVGLGNDEIGYQLEAAKFDPTCYLCFNQEVFGDPTGCPTPNDTRCETYFVNNIGPGADPQLQAVMSGLLLQLNP